MARRRAASKVITGKVRPADPFELIQWLAHCQQDARKAVAELVQNSLDASARRIDVVRRRDKGVLCLSIADDGVGVIPELPRSEALTYIATHVGHSRKRNLTLQERRELMVQGQFGNGILGFWCLGEQLVIRSAVAGETAWELHLFAEEPRYEVRESRGRLSFGSGTEVTVRGLRESVAHLVAARRLGDYLALELRGQLLERGAQITVHDKVARGLAQKVFSVKPVQFPGRRLELGDELAVPGHRSARLELYLLPEADPLRVGLAAGGTLVLDDVIQLDPERLAATAFGSGRFCGVVDFADLVISPGARRGVSPSPATAALVEALMGLLPVLDAEIAAEQHRNDEEVAERQIKRLRRAFLAVRRMAPELELFAVPARSAAAEPESAVAETPPAYGTNGTETAAGGGVRVPQSTTGTEGEEGLELEPATPSLFPPGPLHVLEIVPSRTRVELLGSRVLRAVPRDQDGRRLTLPLPVSWRIASGPGAIVPEGGSVARFRAADQEGETVVEATASDGEVRVSGTATVRTILGAGALGSGLGIPSPNFVDDGAGDWRSRMREGRWEVNRSHPDFREASASERRQLRYLSALLAKEIVAGSAPMPQAAHVLEQMVRLLTLVEAALE